jgi:hypothetical protein
MSTGENNILPPISTGDFSDITATNFPDITANVTATNFPDITANVTTTNFPGITANITTTNFPGITSTNVTTEDINQINDLFGDSLAGGL